MKLKDGSCLGFFSTGSYTNTNTWIPGERGPVAKNTGATDIGYITIDVNDEEEPNIFGKDWYTIPISANGINY